MHCSSLHRNVPEGFPFSIATALSAKKILMLVAMDLSDMGRRKGQAKYRSTNACHSDDVKLVPSCVQNYHQQEFENNKESACVV
jgi:hypothetical protein